MASTLPVSVLLSEAADAEARRARLPSPRNVPIDHFVILMMENRSFDHYFGWVPQRRRHAERELPQPAGPAGADPARLEPRAARSGRAAATPIRATAGTPAARSCSGGFLDAESGNDEFALCYYNRGELGFIHEAARQYTLYDRYFCSLLSSTWPNRYYKWSGQSGGRTNNTPAGRDRRQPVGDDLRPARCARACRARYYASDLPFAAVWGARGRVVDQPGRALLHRVRGGHAAEHLDRRPALPRRRRRRRPVGRRAPARRRAARPGVHVRRGQRVRELAQLPPRRDVHHLRRVGRVLRPRPPAAGDRRAR